MPEQEIEPQQTQVTVTRPANDDWLIWGKYVLKTLETLSAKIVALEARIQRLHEKETDRQLIINDIDARVRSVEKLLKVIGGIGTAIMIFAIIELLKSLFGL